MNKKMKRHAAMVSLALLGSCQRVGSEHRPLSGNYPRRPAYKEPECSTKSLTWPPLRRL